MPSDHILVDKILHPHKKGLSEIVIDLEILLRGF
jgi:hypothetical protein